MYAIKYILVNDSTAKGSACESRHRFIPHIGHCVECFAGSRFLDEPSDKVERKVQGSRERKALIDLLCRLRNHYPETPILGWSELDTSYEHAPVRVNPEMNALRREMSDLD